MILLLRLSASFTSATIFRGKKVKEKMQTEQQHEAEAKFWGNPELLEKLFSTLDLDSTLSLARVMNKDILKRSMAPKVWDSLVRQNLDVKGYIPEGNFDQHDESRRYTLDATQKLASILKIMKTPKALLLDALHVICETDPWDSTDQLELICPSHTEPHSVSGWGFILLEEMEAALGTTEQSIRSAFGVDSMFSDLSVSALYKNIHIFQVILVILDV